MVARFFSAAGLLGAVMFATPAKASEFPQIDQAVQKVEVAIEAWRAADQKLAQMRADQEELAHRIAALKRLREEQRFSQNATLERLLQESVAADEQLTAQARLRDARSVEIDRRIVAADRLINEQYKLLRPGLTSGTDQQKAATARKMKSLQKMQSDVRAMKSRLGGENGAPKEWKKYEVPIDPLDGPGDLREKADFLEDTRDKLRKKIEAAQRRLAETREQNEIARAAQNFSKDVSLFDERSRSSRVPRGANNRGAAEVAVLSGDDKNADGAPNGATNPTAPPPTEPSQGFTDTREATSEDRNTAGAPGPTPLAPSVGVGISGGQLPKQLDPQTLLNLNVKDLEANGDVGSLETLLSSLKELDKYLEGRASSIRQRAQRLEQDEAKALQK